MRFRDYYGDPETMLRTQILAQKWLMENVRTDAYSITGPWVGAWTDFQNTFEAGSLGVDIVFPDDDIPWVGRGWVAGRRTCGASRRWTSSTAGINARQIEYRRAMMAVAEKYPVRFQGGPVFYPGANPALTHTSDGPFGVAGDLMGQTELFMAVKERPDFVRELLRIVTDKLIDYLDFCWAEEQLPAPGLRLDRRPGRLALGRDLPRHGAAGREAAAVPFRRPASLHMCGKTDHLLEIFRDELAIHEFQGFGYQVDLDRIAAAMGGRVVLIGNVNPMLIHAGRRTRSARRPARVIEKLGPRGGLIVQDGNNIPPGSPLENINAMMEAAEAWGRA